jgi:hypothetical protein
MEELQRQHAPDQWKLLIEPSKLSLKAVLLNNGKKLPSVPLPHAGHMKETDNIQGLLEKNMLRRLPVERTCRPECCGIAE